MSQIGRELQLMLQAAYRESTTRRHAYLTVEHLLYALLHDTRGAEILRHSGAQLPALQSALDRFFAEEKVGHAVAQAAPGFYQATGQTLCF